MNIPGGRSEDGDGGEDAAQVFSGSAALLIAPPCVYNDLQEIPRRNP